MPKPLTYTWVCHICHSTNPAENKNCSSCGFQAVASAKDIKAAKETPNTTVKVEEIPAKSKEEDIPAIAFFFIAFGIYLLFGAYSSISNRKWPIFMPPQLDVLAAISGGWDSAIAAYITCGITGVLGLFCVVAGILNFKKYIRNADHN